MKKLLFLLLIPFVGFTQNIDELFLERGEVNFSFEYKNKNLICKEGNSKTKDFENMRSYCYYEGNCLNLGLESLFLTLPNGKELEIIKNQYLL